MAKTQTKINGISEQMLVEIIKRIVAVAKPQKIILFGSGARGQLGPSSDLDILVVKDGVGRRALAQEIYSHMRGIEIGLDIVVATSEDLERFKDSLTVVIGQALKEGKVIYDEAA
jgi:uncharacterized protein